MRCREFHSLFFRGSCVNERAHGNIESVIVLVSFFPVVLLAAVIALELLERGVADAQGADRADSVTGESSGSQRL
jgi:hypothetical protein